MAQHISILYSKIKYHKEIINSIENQFSKGLAMMKYAYKYEQLDRDYNLKENDIVYRYVKMINKKTEVFEIHYDKIQNKIFDIFLVK